MTDSHAKRTDVVNAFEREILRRILGPINGKDVLTFRYNQDGYFKLPVLQAHKA